MRRRESGEWKVTKKHPYRGPQVSAPGALLAIGSGGDHGGRVRGLDRRGSAAQIRAEPGTGRSRGGGRGGSRAAPRRAGHARDRAHPEFPAWSRAKKDPKLRGRAKSARVGRRATLEQGPCAARNDRGGCRSMFPRRARVPSSAPRATARFPATASRDVGSLRRSRTTIWSGACQISQWVRTLEAVVRRAARTGRGGRGDRRQRWQTS